MQEKGKEKARAKASAGIVDSQDIKKETALIPTEEKGKEDGKEDGKEAPKEGTKDQERQGQKAQGSPKGQEAKAKDSQDIATTAGNGDTKHRTAPLQQPTACSNKHRLRKERRSSSRRREEI